MSTDHLKKPKFGSGCINKTIEDAEAKIDADLAADGVGGTLNDQGEKA